MYKFVALIVLIFVGLISWACSGEKPANISVNTNTSANASGQNLNNVSSAPPASPYDEVAAGGKLYATNCSACHRADGTGGKIEIEGKMLDPEDITSDKFKKRSDERLVEYIRDGVPDEGMPAFKDKLGQEEMKAIVKFMRGELQKNAKSASSPTS